MKAKKVLGCFGLLILVGAICMIAIVGVGVFAMNSMLATAGRKSGDTPEEQTRVEAPSGLWRQEAVIMVKGMTSLVTNRETRVEVPDALWQNEVVAIFPITEDVAGFVKLTLSNPQFVSDGDSAWLRLGLSLNAQVVQGGNESFPGHATLRTQLKFDKARREVQLKNAQLVEFTFSGEAGKLVTSLQEALAESVAAELEDFPIVELPEGEGWIQKKGLGLVNDVTIAGGKVVVVLGG